MAGFGQRDPVDLGQQTRDVLALCGPGPVLVAVDQGHRHRDVPIPVARLGESLEAAVDRAGNLGISLAAPALSQLDDEVVRQRGIVDDAAAHDARHDGPVLHRGEHGPENGHPDAADDEAGEQVAALQPARIVITVERDHAAHPVLEVDGRLQRERAAKRFPGQGDVVQVEAGDELDHRGPQARLFVVGTGHDVRPAHTWQVHRVDGERVPQLRDDAVEVVQLRANGMHQHQHGAAACGEVPQARTVGSGEVRNSAVAVGPCVRVGAHAHTVPDSACSAVTGMGCLARAGSRTATTTAAVAAIPALTRDPI